LEGPAARIRFPVVMYLLDTNIVSMLDPRRHAQSLALID
jgi:hypothetical protein